MATGQAQTRKATIGKAYQLIPVIGPSAGVDLRTSPTLLPADRARSLVNFSLAEPGALVVRKGFQAFSTGSLGAGRIQGGARIYLNTAIPAAMSTSFTVVGYNGGLYLQTDSGGWSSTTPQLTGLSTNELSFPSDRDQVAVMDGSTTPWASTNGSSWVKMGVASGPAASLSSLSTGGLSAGDYELNYTYKARGLALESNGSSSPQTLTIAGTSGAIKIVIPNSTQPQVQAIVVYARKTSVGETIRRKVSSLAQVAGASSTLVVTSTAWTTNDEEPDDHDVPPALSFGVVWKNRWWARSATVTNRLHFTQLFQPQSWPALFYIDIPFERGDAIQACVPLGDTLLIFGTTRIFIILGQTSLDFEVRPTIASQEGAFGFRAAAPIENGVVHAGASGIYIFDGTADKLLSYDLDPAWRDLVGNTAANVLAKVAMVYHQKEKELRVAVPRRYPTTTDGEWIMDLNRTRTNGDPAWSMTDRTVGGYIAWDGPEVSAGDRGRLFSWDTTTARLFEEAVGTSANSSNLTAQYEGPGLTLGAFRGRYVDVRGEYEPNSGTFSIEPVVDGLSQGTKSVAIGASLATYGSAIYGTATYPGAGRRQFYNMLPLTSDGRTFVLKATYTGQQQYRWFSYHVGLVPETKSRSFTE